jgi:hypothetical protein
MLKVKFNVVISLARVIFYLSIFSSISSLTVFCITSSLAFSRLYNCLSTSKIHSRPVLCLFILIRVSSNKKTHRLLNMLLLSAKSRLIAICKPRLKTSSIICNLKLEKPLLNPRDIGIMLLLKDY